MDLIKIAEEAFATGKQHPLKVARNAFSCIAVLLSKSQVTVKRNVSLYVRCQEL